MRVLKNSLWLTLSSIISKVIAFFTIILIARNLGVEQFGVYALIFTIIGLASLLANYGFDPLMIREIARNPFNTDLTISNSTFLKFVFSLLSLIILLTIGIFLRNDLLLPLFILGASFLIYNPLMTISAAFYGKEQMIWSGLIQVSGDAIRLIVVIYFLSISSGLLSIVTAYAVSNLIVCLILIFIGKYKIELHFKIDSKHFGKIIKQAFPFALNAVIFMVYFRIDIIILSWLKGDLSVGSYSAAYRIIDAFLFVPASVMGAVFPAFSRKYGVSDSIFWVSFEKIVKYLTIVGIPIGFSITVLAPKIIALLYSGAQWEASIIYLQVLIWTITLIFINCSFPVALNARGKQKISAIVLLAGSGVNIILNLLLIPPLNALGASIATVITEVVTTVVYLYIFRETYSPFKLYRILYKPILASLCMVFIILALYKFNLAIIIGSGLFVYVFSILLLKALDSDDYEILFPNLKRTQGIPL